MGATSSEIRLQRALPLCLGGLCSYLSQTAGQASRCTVISSLAGELGPLADSLVREPGRGSSIQPYENLHVRQCQLSI